MADNQLKEIELNRYLDSAKKYLQCKDFDAAKKNLALSAKVLYEMAINDSGELQKERIKRADALMEQIKLIDKKIEESNARNLTETEKNDESVFNIKKIDNDNVTLEESISNLNNLIGLSEVKQQVSDFIDQVKVFKIRKEQGLTTPEMSYHMVFTGNPGTGKTTVARIIGQIYKALGIVSKGQLVEVDRSDIVEGYIGHTEKKVKKIVEEAKGGVLFIDEAYALKKDNGNDFGQEAIDTLVKEMEDKRADFVVIVAGYENEMKKFIDSNPGLKSRFRTYIDFKDYSGEELYKIFLGILKKNMYIVTDEANQAIFTYLTHKEINAFTGNARDVRNLFENIIQKQNRRLAEIQRPSQEELITITIEDLPFDLSKIDELLEKIDNVDVGNEDNPEKKLLVNNPFNSEFKFNWDNLPTIHFDDIAGLDYAKEIVRTKVILPLQHPDVFEGYMKKNGGGLFLYGPPGTGKTMIGAAIANEIGAKFCSVKPSDLLYQGAGNTEKAVRTLFAQARTFPCAVIYFDEMDAIAQKSTKSSYAKQLRSELLAQMQGIESYSKEKDSILFLIAATNKPWDVDSAFVRPGRFGTKIYVGLPERDTREYMIKNRFNKVIEKGIVSIDEDVNIDEIVEKTSGYNGSDITNLLDRIDELSAIRALTDGTKYICQEDILNALNEIHSTVQLEDIEKLTVWKQQNL